MFFPITTCLQSVFLQDRLAYVREQLQFDIVDENDVMDRKQGVLTSSLVHLPDNNTAELCVPLAARRG